MDKNSHGRLFICATPIGNLEDVTARVLRVLGEVDFIAAEDTRHTAKLLNYFNIRTPLVSYHEHNMERSGDAIVERLKNGETAALTTDAGMPCVSDPGFELVRLCGAEGVPVTVCPGASAVTAAAALSGLDCGRFVFEGFLPTDNRRREDTLKALRFETRAVVIYESPKRVGDTLKELTDALGADRPAAVMKELTKAFERVERGTLGGLSDMFAGEQRGEFVIVVGGAVDAVGEWGDIPADEHVALYEARGLTLKDAMKAAAKDRGVAKSEIYAKLLETRR